MEKERLRSKQYLETPEGRLKINTRKKLYKRVARHIDLALKELLDETEILSLDEISYRIKESKNIKLRNSTIEKLLNRYVKKFGNSPLEMVDENNYKLNDSFYKTPLSKTPKYGV